MTIERVDLMAISQIVTLVSIVACGTQRNLPSGSDVAFLQELLNLKWAVPARLGFGWPSLCNRVAQTWGSVPCSTQKPMPTMMAALVAAALGQRLNTNRSQRHPRSRTASVCAHTYSRRT